MNEKILIFIKSNQSILENILDKERELVKEKMAGERDEEKRKEMWYVADYLSAKLNDLKGINKPLKKQDSGI